MACPDFTVHRLLCTNESQKFLSLRQQWNLPRMPRVAYVMGKLRKTLLLPYFLCVKVITLTCYGPFESTTSTCSVTLCRYSLHTLGCSGKMAKNNWIPIVWLPKKTTSVYINIKILVTYLYQKRWGKWNCEVIAFICVFYIFEGDTTSKT